jgi:Cdc6-like AAA superfamily ATPase
MSHMVDIQLTSTAGAGKTMLASKVIDSLANKPASEGVAYFYCNRNENQRRQAQQIQASFIKQLSISTKLDALPKPLLSLYEEKERTGLASNIISIEESESLLKDLSQMYPQTTLILDAMDECDQACRSTLLKVFSSLVESAKMF